MNIFVSDLDNTLIYSYKRDIGLNKVLVESKDGKELSYMSKQSYGLLAEVNHKLPFIPLTTRSLEQYRRIKLLDACEPAYALAGNGGLLLYKGEIDKNWYLNSLKLIESAEAELIKSIEILKNDSNTIFEVRKVDDLFVFTKSSDVEAIMQRLRDALNPLEVTILNNGSKIYVIPAKLNKGTAVKRLTQFLGAGYLTCAGDSIFDLPMLSAADLAILPERLDTKTLFEHSNKFVVGDQKLFSDALLQKVLDCT